MSTKYVKLLEKAKDALEDARDALSGNGKCDRIDALDAIYYALLAIKQVLPAEPDDTAPEPTGEMAAHHE